MLMESHEIDYKIIGNDIQLVEVELDPEETVIAEAGAMMYITDGVEFQAKMGDGSDPNKGFFGKLASVGGRMLTGESVFMTHFTHRGEGKAHVAFSAPYPGTIVPVKLSDMGGSLVVQKDGFLCAAKGTKVSITFNKRFGAGLLGGEGFIMQKLEGDGMAFFHAGGTVIERQLNNEKIRVDTGCVVAYEPTVDFSVEKAGSLKSMVFGGEGLFLATLQGTGKIWMQSMPIRKLIQAIAPYGKNTGKGSGGALGGLLGS